MSGYGSQQEVREIIAATLRMEGRDPEHYNITSIMRDAFYYRGAGYGWGAENEATWRRAVEKARKPKKGERAMRDSMQTTTRRDGYPATRVPGNGRREPDRLISAHPEPGGPVRLDIINPQTGELKSWEVSRETWNQLARDIADHAALHCGSCDAHIADPHAPGCPDDDSEAEEENQPCQQ